MADEKLDEGKVAVVNEGPYVEDDRHIPNPTDQFGTYDTSGTAGAAHSDLTRVSPVFDVAKAQDLVTAARALDPDDDEVPEHLVVKPPVTLMDQVDHDAIRERVTSAAEAAIQNPIVVGGQTPAQEEAAKTDEETGGEKTEKAARHTRSQGAGAGGQA